MHAVEDFVDLDSMIDYPVMKHDTAPMTTRLQQKGTAMLAYMSGEKSSCGVVQQVVVSNQQPDKNMSIQKRQVNEVLLLQALLQLMV
jgi:hypothetical protein